MYALRMPFIDFDQFHAEYGKGVDTYMHHRIAQGWDLAKLLRGAAERGRFVIAVAPSYIRNDRRPVISIVARIPLYIH